MTSQPSPQPAPVAHTANMSHDVVKKKGEAGAAATEFHPLQESSFARFVSAFLFSPLLQPLNRTDTEAEEIEEADQRIGLPFRLLHIHDGKKV